MAAIRSSIAWASARPVPIQDRPVYRVPAAGARSREWATDCSKYAACDVPVYFGRMDDNSGKLDQWKEREHGAERAASTLALGKRHS